MYNEKRSLGPSSMSLFFFSSESELIGLQVIISGPQPLGTEHEIIITFVEGFQAEAEIEYGDGTNETYSIHSPSEIPRISHEYKNCNTYLVKVQVTNR